MFRRIKNNINGQATTLEYVVLFFIVVGFIIGTASVVQRGLQGRVFDAKSRMLNEVNVQLCGENINGVVQIGDCVVEPAFQYYEPYYTNVASVVEREFRDETQLTDAGITGIFSKTIDMTTEVRTRSTQRSAEDADATDSVVSPVRF